MDRRFAAGVAVCGVFAAVVWLHWPDAMSDRVWAYEPLHQVNHRLLRGDAQGFVAAKAEQGYALRRRHGGGTSFQVLCKGVRVLDVTIAPSRVVMRMPADALWRAPDVEHLRVSLHQWLQHGQGRRQWLVAQREPTWLQMRVRGAGVPPVNGERCLPGEAVEQARRHGLSG